MLSTYLTLALRRMRRHLGYTALNVVGLAIGLAGCLLIAGFVWAELDVDRFHAEADRIYRVVQETDEGGSAWTGGGHAALLTESTAGIEATVRVAPWERTISVPEASGSERAVFAEPTFAYADPSFFDVFSFQFVSGDPETALAEPGTVVITETVADRYFGETDPLGRIVLMYDGYSEPNQIPLTVTGVLADSPHRSHLDVSILSSTETLEGQYGPLTQFDWPGLYTYARLASGADPQAVEVAATRALEDRLEEDGPELLLQPLPEIYLRPQPEGEPKTMGSIGLVYGLSSLALVVLLLACINFANLSVARATSQVRAAGIRQSVGAHRSQLVGESLVDTFALISIAMIIALGMVWAALPWARTLTGQDLTLGLGASPGNLLLLVGLLVVSGFVAGGYPAFLVSRQQPVLSLRGMVRRPRGAARLRSALIVAQFTCSVVLLVGALVVHGQLDYVRDLRLGFDREQIVTVDGGGARRAFEPLRDAFDSVPGVEAVTASMGIPGVQEIRMPRVARQEGREDGGIPIHTQGIGPEYFETLEIQLVAGHAPRADTREDSVEPVQARELPIVLNESAVSAMGWVSEEALGQRIRVVEPGNEANSPGFTGTVVGVAADIHHGSARTRIPPSAYYSAQSLDVPDLYVISHVLVKLAPGASAETIGELKTAWHRVLPDHPFEASFLDVQVQSQYEADLRLGRTIGLFAALAVLVACLGLFGLASLVAEQRTQEVGVRKSLGATSAQIAALLSGNFLRLILFAFVLAIPIAYVAAQRWLDAFAYQIDLGPGLFILAGVVVTLVALIAVSVQTLRAARANPVEALRYE